MPAASPCEGYVCVTQITELQKELSPAFWGSTAPHLLRPILHSWKSMQVSMLPQCYTSNQGGKFRTASSLPQLSLPPEWIQGCIEQFRRAFKPLSNLISVYQRKDLFHHSMEADWKVSSRIIAATKMGTCGPVRPQKGTFLCSNLRAKFSLHFCQFRTICD